MASTKALTNALKALIEQEGTGVLTAPDGLAGKLKQEGLDEVTALKAQLALTACPALSAAAQGGTIDYTEANTFVTAIVREGGFAPQEARDIVGGIVAATGISKENYQIPLQRMGEKYFGEKLSDIVRKRGTDVTLMDDAEDETLAAAVEGLQDKEQLDASLSELDKLARGGNAVAAYQIALFVQKQDEVNGTKRAIPYFTMAAELGYGPAYGALASYETADGHGNLRTAAKYLEHPLALEGQEGRKWANLQAKLIDYREANGKRGWGFLALAVLLIALVLLIGTAHPIPGMVVVLIGTYVIVTTLISKAVEPFGSYRVHAVLLLVGWLISFVLLLS